MDVYLDIVRKVIQEGVKKENRTGIPVISYFSPLNFEHDMSEGYPLLTTKKINFQLVASELEFFVKGLTDKRWLQERGNHIWDGWADRRKVRYGHDPETKNKMLEERDLGPIYGFQWRHFGAGYQGFDADYKGQGIDQLYNLVETIKKNPTDRRMIVTAWNPVQNDQMGLPPCHYVFNVNITNNKLNLKWSQRSVDLMLGLPFNIASYGLLLHLLAKETGYQEGRLIGSLDDTHIYENHLRGAEEQLSRKPCSLPVIETEPFTSIFDWQYTNTKVNNYQHHPFIKFTIAV